VVIFLLTAIAWLFAAPVLGIGLSPMAQPADLQIVVARSNCADLTKVDVVPVGGAGSRIDAAIEKIDVAGATVCSVTGTLAPAVSFRVDLPLKTWTQRYLQTGCGGLCGSLNITVGAADGCPTIATGGFVLATTDMGHKGMGAEFGLDAQKRADFAYRGVHLTSVAAKLLIRAFYGQTERYSYFDGCSDGGREALVEAERFPADFNGIIAGAPAMNFTIQNSFYHGWQARSNTGGDGRAILIASRLPIIHDAVLKVCDGLDGLMDGLVSMPGQCRFDPLTLVCKDGEEPNTCLTKAEAAVALRFYEGPRDLRTGERLTQGGPQFGSELQWAGVYVPQFKGQPIFSTMIANGSMADVIFPNGRPATVAQLAFDRETLDRARQRHSLYDASSPDLTTFVARGGKLIMFHGWADPHISPLNTIAYQDALNKFFGSSKVEGFERLYLMPGMGHCSGGEGPSAFNLLTPMLAWVEKGEAPDAIMTSTPAPGPRSTFVRPGGMRLGLGAGGMPAGMIPHTVPSGASGHLDASNAREMGSSPRKQPMMDSLMRTRPVYPYPFVATFKGTGNPNEASGWTKGRSVPVVVPNWAGSDYYKPYAGATG
jgi:hypothetical protein